jgi:hypothetical protein
MTSDAEVDAGYHTVRRCGAIPFNKRVDGFEPAADLLAPAGHAMLYSRGVGRLRSALDLPMVAESPSPTSRP